MLARRGRSIGLGPGLVVLEARVLVLVAVDAQELPVRAVGRIVVVIAVAVMDRQLAQPPSLELAPAARADVGQDSQSLFPVFGRRILNVL
jgi:hypothetical protein